MIDRALALLLALQLAACSALAADPEETAAAVTVAVNEGVTAAVAKASEDAANGGGSGRDALEYGAGATALSLLAWAVARYRKTLLLAEPPKA